MRIAFALCVVLLFTAWAAPAALAAYGVTNFSAVPASPDAGANSDFTISYDFQEPSHQLKDVLIHLPPGLLGNPLATTTCSEAQLNANSCPPASAVGTVRNTVVPHNLPGPPITANGIIYNVNPRPGEPARFGFVLTAPGSPPIIVQSGASLRPGDLGLDTTLNDLPRTVGGLQIDITHIDFTLKGQVGSPPQGFLRNPTSCGGHPTGIDVVAYDGQTASAQTSFDTVNCAALPFSPQFSAHITQTNASNQPVEVSTSIKQTIAEAGLKRAIVTLPADLGSDTSIFVNSCDEASFQAGTCPAASVIGSARATSPLQSEPLTGPVALVASPTPGALPDIGLDLRGSLGLKLKGQLGLDTSNPAALRGQVTFDNLPDIPISDFTLTFKDGEGGLNVAGRNPCKPPPFMFDTNFLSFAGTTVNSTTDASATCGDKEPRAKVKLAKRKSAKPTLRFQLKAGGTPIRSAKLKLPRSLRFAGGRAFKRGSTVKADRKKLKGGALKARKRSLKLKVKGKGAAKIKGRLRGGAVRARGKGKAKGRIKVNVRDVNGNRTKLSVRVK